MNFDVLAHRIAANNHTLDGVAISHLIEMAANSHVPVLEPGEFLLPLRPDGMPSPTLGQTGRMIKKSLATTHKLGDWLCVEDLAGEPVILVARWLCHRIGLRHRTVQIILDHPTHDDYTLVQVRSFDKVDAPGAFDLPCAGHVIGTETIERSLAKELGEELGLTLADLVELREIAHYEYRDLDQRPGFLNVEYRAVHRARLREGALDRITFADGEVAGLAVMSVAAVRDLVERASEQVASGLRGSMAWL